MDFKTHLKYYNISGVLRKKYSLEEWMEFEEVAGRQGGGGVHTRFLTIQNT